MKKRLGKKKDRKSVLNSGVIQTMQVVDDLVIQLISRY